MCRVREKLSTSFRGDFFASQIGGGDGVGVGHAQVGSDGMAGEELGSGDGVRLLFDEDKVSVVAGC